MAKPNRFSSATDTKLILLAGCVAMLTTGACDVRPQADAEVERARPASDTRPPPPRTPPAPRSTWSNFNFVNEWGEQDGRGARSEQRPPVNRMSFPYHDVEAALYVSCSSAWIRFTDSPNLTNDDIADGYSISQLRVRLDGRDDRWRATQKWGANDLNLPESARNAWTTAKTFEVLVPWYGEGSVRFSWDLTGSADAIAKTCES